jgi:hypothetical protein
MKWDQIENKWAAMTRRIRADWAADRIEATGNAVPGRVRLDAAVATIAESQTTTRDVPELKPSAK